MSKTNKNNIIYSNKKLLNKNIFFGNISPKMSDPAFQINNTLKHYINRKLNENKTDIDKQLFKNKKNKKQVKSFHNFAKRNNRTNNYTINSNSKDNLQLFSSLQNLSISIINSNNKNNINDDLKNILKNMTSKKKVNENRIFSYTKINDKKLNKNKKEYINKSSQKIKFSLSGKIKKIKAKNIFKKYIHSSSMKNIKIKKSESKMNKSNIREKEDGKFKTLFRFNSGDLKNFQNINLFNNRYSIKSNMENNNNLSLTQRINYNSLNQLKNNEKKNKINISNNTKKNNTKNKKITKNYSTFQSNKNNKKVKNWKENKILNKRNKDTNSFNKLNKIKSQNTDNNKIKNNINDINNYYISSLGKTEPNNNSSIYNFHLKEKKISDGYELYWNLKNDYSKDIDISLISINNQKKSVIKNYKLNPSKIPNNYYNDNNNINNIYLNNIQNVNNINNQQSELSIITNKAEYYSKLQLLENENKILKNEIKESKNRIYALEYKIEELLDDKNSKENSECPQPTPYVIKYSKDILPSKIIPKIQDNSQEQNLKSNNEILKEYSKNETKESDISNRIINKNEVELNNKKANL